MITDLPDEAFTEPWQARLFAMAQVACSGMGLHWDAFRDRLKAAIAEQPERPYYESWMVALEQLTGCSPAEPGI